MRHLRKLLVALGLGVFALLVLRFGNTVLIRFEPDLESQSFGTTDDGGLPMRFSERRAWVRHDEHYHVDFGFR